MPEPVEYIRDYQSALNPVRAALAMLSAGVASPGIETACELGFGQGISLNVHAAASSVRWFGTDMQASHVASARELARASGAAVTVLGDPIGELVERHPDLPDFDYIALHGVWSWVGEGDRQSIVEFVRRKLKPGGLLYLDYYTLPGWSSFLPLRQLLNERMRSTGRASGDPTERVRDAFAFVEGLLAVAPTAARLLPQGVERLEALVPLDRRYLVHELFSGDWALMDFATVRRNLAPAGLVFGCSANFSDHTDVTSLTAAQRRHLDGIDDIALRESARDLFVMRRHRYEYWIRGERTLPAAQRDARLREQRVVSVTREVDLPARVRAALVLNGAGGEPAPVGPVLSVLSDHVPRTLGEIEVAVRRQGIPLSAIVQAVLLLSDFGYVDVAQDTVAIERARSSCARLNRRLLADATAQDAPVVLASPVTGGGVRLEPTGQQPLERLSILQALGVASPQP